MSDLISRQAAIDAIEHRLAEPAYLHTGEDWYVGMNCAESELYDLPSAQPEIIRCKDCKHYGTSFILKRNGYKEDRNMCFREGVDGFTECYVMLPDDYCSYAERRSD